MRATEPVDRKSVVLSGLSVRPHWPYSLVLLTVVFGCVSITQAAITPTGDVSQTYNGNDDPWMTGFIRIGDTGVGTLEVDGSSRVETTAPAMIGWGSTGSGAVTISGTGSAWEIEYAIVVGVFGQGSLTIEHGATVTSGETSGTSYLNTIGLSNGLDNSVTVRDPGSTWTAIDRIDIGLQNGASGKLAIEDGGKVYAIPNGNLPYTEIYLGRSGGHGRIEVQGPGSLLSIEGYLPIGGLHTGQAFPGGGDLIVSDGGEVYVVQASTAGSDSSITVTGEGSMWTSLLGLVTYGSGTLNVGPGAEVHASGSFGLSNSGTFNLSGGTVYAYDYMSSLSENFNFTGGTLKTLEYFGDLTNAGGTFAPGISTAVSTVSGTYEQNAASTLQIELGGVLVGDDYDQLDVSGQVTLGGLLEVDLIDGYTPAVGDTFEVLTSATGISGFFASVDVPGMTVLYRPNGITLEARLLGDTDGDGFVGITDLNLILGNWNQSVPAGSWIDGDTSGDGFVGIEDLNLILTNWNTGTPPDVTTLVPEPTSSVILALLSLGMYGRPSRCGVVE